VHAAQKALTGRPLLPGLAPCCPPAQVRDAIIAENDANVRGRRGRSGREGGAGGAARPAAPPSLDKLVAAMQRDSATYCDEPADTAAFAAFQAGFSLEARFSARRKGDAALTDDDACVLRH
jgi:hypothetical protein